MLRKFFISIGTIGTIGTIGILNNVKKEKKEWCNCHEYCHGTGYVSKEGSVSTFGHDGYVCGCDCGC